jgi:hypothetical protein
MKNYRTARRASGVSSFSGLLMMLAVARLQRGVLFGLGVGQLYLRAAVVASFEPDVDEEPVPAGRALMGVGVGFIR